VTELAAAIEALAAGLPVILPTDTVYGVGVDPARPGATARLFRKKARPADVALPVLAADAEQAFALAAPPASALALAERFWPGPLTIVVPRAADVGFDLGGGDAATIGLRVPDHDVPRDLARAVGPLAVTSANRHGEPTATTAAEAVAALGRGVGAVVDGGTRAGAPSTVVRCTDDGVWILRLGALGPAELRAAGARLLD
jgi:L-threonylcarbamoyladenylate synthase